MEVGAIPARVWNSALGFTTAVVVPCGGHKMFPEHNVIFTFSCPLGLLGSQKQNIAKAGASGHEQNQTEFAVFQLVASLKFRRIPISDYSVSLE